MKVKLENEGMINRGVVLESGTPGDLVVLENLWTRKGKIVVWARKPDNVVELTIAPTEM